MLVYSLLIKLTVKKKHKITYLLLQRLRVTLVIFYILQTWLFKPFQSIYSPYTRQTWTFNLFHFGVYKNVWVRERRGIRFPQFDAGIYFKCFFKFYCCDMCINVEIYETIMTMTEKKKCLCTLIRAKWCLSDVWIEGIYSTVHFLILLLFMFI